MEASGIINLKQKKARDYSLFFLKRNPFPAIGVPSDVLVTVDRGPIIERFQNVVAELQESGTGIITVLVGAYGSGKSHLLKSFKQSVNDQLLSRDNGTIAIYVKSPGEGFRDFFLGFIEDIGRPLLTLYSEEIIREYAKNDKSNARAFIHDQAFYKPFDDDLFEVGAYMNASRHLDLIRVIRETKFSQVGSRDLVSAFIMLSHPENGSNAWRWFLGEGLNRPELELANVDSSIEEDAQAYSTFSNFLTLMQVIGVKSVVLLVDELEKITSITPRKSADYQDFLRRMIDEHNKDICFYFSISPRQWADLTQESTALVRRLSGNWYELDDFDVAYTRELIEKYLFPARLETFSSKESKASFPDCEPSLAPFTNESVEAIHQLSQGRISDIILICRKLLEYVFDYRDQYKSISPDLVNYLKEKEKLG